MNRNMREVVVGRADDVVIVGGGIIGLAIARAAARAGMRTSVLEMAEPGAAASAAAAGLLSPQLEAERPGPWLDLGLRSRDLYPEFAGAVRDESGIDPGLARRGILVLEPGPEEAGRLEARLAAQRALGLPAETVRGEALRRLEPALTTRVSGALLLPADGWIDAALLVRGLRVAAGRAGARLRFGARVTGLRRRGDAVTGVLTDAGPVAAGAVVIAAGAWSSQIAAAGLPPVPVHPVRGQIVCRRLEPGALGHALYSEECYLVPRGDGRVLAGSTMERVGFDARTTPEAVAALRSAAIELVPALGRARGEEAWAGLRPATGDGLPAIGPGGARGLFYATGHLRNGILLAPVTARIVTRLLLGEDPGCDLAPFSPRRFGGAPRAGPASRPPEPPRAA
jgi:glycine oxidase